MSDAKNVPLETTPTIDLLKSRTKLAKGFTKKWREDVKKWLKDYEIETFDNLSHDDLYNKLQIPYIFSTTESTLPSMFERMPALIMEHRGKEDRDFTEWVASIWTYVVVRTHLEEKIEEGGLYMLLSGLFTAQLGWISETEMVPQEREEPIIDPQTGEQVDVQVITEEKEVPVVNLPKITIPHYDNVHFSPESRFASFDEFGDIPYIVVEEPMSPEAIEEFYGKKVDSDTYMNVKDISDELEIEDKDLCKEDIKRINVVHYYGILPKVNSGDKKWKANRVYSVDYCSSMLLSQPKRIAVKPIVLERNYASPRKFLPWGEPKVLRELEQDISLGRSMMADYRDRVSTKVAIPKNAEFDEEGFKKPRKFSFVRMLSDVFPQYITPPPIPQAIPMTVADDRADIQMASAQLDISRGGDSNTVQTATGQQIFQQAVEKRINRKRMKIGRVIRSLSKQILIACANNWSIDEFAAITDTDLADPEAAAFLEAYIEKLKLLGNEYDVNIEVESITVNKATKAAQAIALYDKMMLNPFVNQQELTKFVLQQGFDIKDLDKFYLEPGSPEAIMQQQMMMQMQGGPPANPEGGSEPTIPTDDVKTNSRQMQTESMTERIPQ